MQVTTKEFGFQNQMNKEFESRVREKLMAIREKGNVTCDQEVKSLTNFYPVVKTWTKENSLKIVDEVRMAYDATKSGLNDSMYAP